MEPVVNQSFATAIKQNYLGWLGFFILFNLYCALWRQYGLQIDYNLMESLTWFVKEWGIWLLISPMMLYWLEWSQGKFSVILRVGIAGAVGIALALIARVYLNTGEYPSGWMSIIVIMLPSYLPACVIFFALWYFIRLRSGSTFEYHGDESSQRVRLKDEPETSISLDHQGLHMSLVESEIFSLKTAGNYVEIHCAEKSYLKRTTLKDLLSEFSEGRFLQVHRSHAINISKLVKLVNTENGGGSAILTNQKAVPISKRYKADLKSIQISN